jgi:putative DNA primase/helicase
MCFLATGSHRVTTDNEDILSALESAKVLAFPSTETGVKSKPSRGHGKPGDGRKPPPPEPPSSEGGGGGSSKEPDARIVIKRAGNQLHVETRRAIETISTPVPLIFRYGNTLVVPEKTIVKMSKGGSTFSAYLKAADEGVIRDALGTRSLWLRMDSRTKTWTQINPPKEIATQILSLVNETGFPVISQVTVIPTLRPDGSLLDKPGYDDRSGAFYLPDHAIDIGVIPERPSLDEANGALEYLSFLVSEFPFVEDVDRSVALSMILTLALRLMFDVVPAHATTAPAIGTGKSLLSDIAAMIASGERAGVIGASRDLIEVEKAVNGVMLSGQNFVVLDNLTGLVESTFISQCIERPILTLRPLGSSVPQRIANGSMFVLNGNNLALSNDLIRRVLLCHLDAQMERPYLREHSFDVIHEISANRSRYLRAILILGRFGLASQPHGKPELASFVAWDRCVRRALIALGCTDPISAINATESDDPARQALMRVLTCLRDAFGNTSFSIRDTIAASAKNSGLDIPDGATIEDEVKKSLHDALMDVAEIKGIISVKRLGIYFQKNKAKVINGLSIKHLGNNDHEEVYKYRIISSLSSKA